MQNDFPQESQQSDQYFCSSPQSSRNSLQQNQKQMIEPNVKIETDEKNNLSSPNSHQSQKQQVLKEPVKPKKDKQKAERSVFHNFQKHLVITLRQTVKIQKSSNKNQSFPLASQIWSIFLKQSRIFTKNILHVVYGVIDYEANDLVNMYDEEMMEKFGFGHIFKKNSESSVQEAQQYLRCETVRQLSNLNLKDFMKSRRISQRQQFIEYVKQFVSQLSQGPMRRRLPKVKKAEMRLKKLNNDE